MTATSIRPASSRPTGDLPDALRVWADNIYLCARLSAKRREPMAPRFVAGTDMTDWRSHMNPREWGVIRELIRAGVWSPEED